MSRSRRLQSFALPRGTRGSVKPLKETRSRGRLYLGHDASSNLITICSFVLPDAFILCKETATEYICMPLGEGVLLEGAYYRLRRRHWGSIPVP